MNKKIINNCLKVTSLKGISIYLYSGSPKKKYKKENLFNIRILMVIFKIITLQKSVICEYSVFDNEVVTIFKPQNTF